MIAHWRVVVVGPDGQRDRGSLTSVLLGDDEPTPETIAMAMADIAYRMAYDMAVARSTPAPATDALADAMAADLSS